MKLTDPGTLYLFLLAGIVVLLLASTRVRLAAQRRRWTEEDGARGTPAARPLPDDLAQWEVQMHETARQLSAQLDAKLSLLQSLTAEADRAAERLEEALQQTSAAPPPSPVADNKVESLSEHPDAGVELDHMAGVPASSEGSDRSRRREEIYELADYGFAPAEIARRLGSPIGEVELILSLRPK
jgi:hypothetical protein